MTHPCYFCFGLTLIPTDMMISATACPGCTSAAPERDLAGMKVVRGMAIRSAITRAKLGEFTAPLDRTKETLLGLCREGSDALRAGLVRADEALNRRWFEIGAEVRRALGDYGFYHRSLMIRTGGFATTQEVQRGVTALALTLTSILGRLTTLLAMAVALDLSLATVGSRPGDLTSPAEFSALQTRFLAGIRDLATAEWVLTVLRNQVMVTMGRLGSDQPPPGLLESLNTLSRRIPIPAVADDHTN